MKLDKKKKRKWMLAKIKILTAILSAGIFTLSPCIPWILGSNMAKAEEFKIVKRYEGKMISKSNDTFFGEPITFDLLYWMKTDGTPLFCIQKEATLVGELDGIEWSESYNSEKYMSKKQYELISLVLQCCGQRKKENGQLEPGEYMAGQVAIWGIQSIYWDGTDKLKQEMNNFYQHVIDLNNVSAETLISQSENMIDYICQVIDDYYSDKSDYIPSFASKYEEKAPVWSPKYLEDGSCEIVFELGEKNPAIKDFVYQLPDGWNYEWDKDQIIFKNQQPKNGLISITGTAMKDSILDEALPIGLIYVVRPKDYEDFQRLVSGIEITTPWSCYFKLSISNPYYEGDWYLPEVLHYKHEEDFTATYGVELEKVDGDTKEALIGVEFQPIEYFDNNQLKETVLDQNQFENWNGWKARCNTEITDENGMLKHLDKKEYHYKKTYCGGHPDPIINYEGDFPARQEQLEEEAALAWKKEVEHCEKICDFHSIDGSGKELLEEDRNLAYEQFTHLIYGYTFQETKPLEGYLPYGENEKDKPIEKIFCTSVEAGGEYDKEAGELKMSFCYPQIVKASKESDKKSYFTDVHEASPSNAKKKVIQNENKNKQGNSIKNEDNTVLYKSEQEDVNAQIQDKGELKGTEKLLASSSTAERVSEKQRKNFKEKAVIWLTSLINPLIPESVAEAWFYLFSVENYKVEIPPEETKPEESTPEETLPEETTSQETTPEETLPEETTSQETTPEETLPEETSSQETTSEETLPEETSSQETTPEETLPQETSSQESTPEETLPQETSSQESAPEETLPQETSRQEMVSEATLPEESSSKDSSSEETPSKESPYKPSKPSGGNKGGGKTEIIIKPETEPETVPKTEPETVEEPKMIDSPKSKSNFSTTPVLLKNENLRGGKIQARYSLSFIEGRAGRRGQTFELVKDEKRFGGRLVSENNGKSSKNLEDSDEGQSSRKRTSGFPKTGDSGSGIAIFLFVTAGTGMAVSAAYLHRQKKRGKKGSETGKKKIFPAILFPLFFVLLCIQDIKAEEESPQDIQEAELILYFPIEDEEVKPESLYVDETGQKYQLEFYHQIEDIIPESEENVSEVIFYPGVEADSQIPETISFDKQEIESGMDGSGELRKNSMAAQNQHWEDSFQFPLTVYDYDADYYELSGNRIPKEETLTFLLEHPQILLEEIGCSQDRYQIDEIVWNGDDYWVQGHLCRDATGFGKKLVSDVSVEYQGIVHYPEWTKKQWQVVYSPLENSEEETAVRAETETAEIGEAAEETESLIQELPAAKRKKKSRLSIVRTIVGYSISFIVFVPFLFCLVLFWRKKSRDKDKIQGMER